MSLIGYDADERIRYYIDDTGVTYVGEPDTKYGVLTPLTRRTTARQDSCTEIVLFIFE
jgi:hypothetical protein